MPEPTKFTRRRLDRVLDPDLLPGLGEADVETLDRVRQDADQEEAELSYVRRLLQARVDQVSAELQRRSTAEPARVGVATDQQLVQMLSSILVGRSGAARSNPSGGLVAGPTRYIIAEADHELRRRRAAEVAAADVRLSSPEDLSDDDLAAAHSRLTELEEQVSAVRRRVQAVADAITAETARRDGL